MHQVLVLKGYKIPAISRPVVTHNIHRKAVPRVLDRYADSKASEAKPSIISLP